MQNAVLLRWKRRIFHAKARSREGRGKGLWDPHTLKLAWGSTVEIR